MEAISHLNHGLEIIDTLPDSPALLEQELAFQTTLGPAMLATKGWSAPEPNATYQRAHELCQKVGDAGQSFSALWGIWLFHLDPLIGGACCCEPWQECYTITRIGT